MTKTEKRKEEASGKEMENEDGDEEEEVHLTLLSPPPVAVGAVCPELCLQAAELFMPVCNEIN